MTGFFRRVEALNNQFILARVRQQFRAIGPNTEICVGSSFDFPDRISIGNWAHLGPRGQFFGRGGLTIADHVIIGPRVTIMTSMHNYRAARFVPYDEVELLNPVGIGPASWIGLGAIILPGVVLGRGCIVGAGSVVTKAVPEGSIVAGNPAKVIGHRDMQEFSDHLANGRTYLLNKSVLQLEKLERARQRSHEAAGEEKPYA